MGSRQFGTPASSYTVISIGTRRVLVTLGLSHLDTWPSYRYICVLFAYSSSPRPVLTVTELRFAQAGFHGQKSRNLSASHTVRSQTSSGGMQLEGCTYEVVPEGPSRITVFE